MSIVGQAFLGFLQFKRETVWGTDVAATNRLPFNRIDPWADIGRVRAKTMDGGLAQAQVVAGGSVGRAVVELPLTYTGMLIMLDAIMGTASFNSSGGTTTGSNPFTHTWTGFGRYMNSLVLEMGIGDIPTTKCEQLLGSKVTKATIRGAAGLSPDDGITTCVLEFVGKALTTGVTPTGSLVSPTPDPVLFTHLAAPSDSLGSAMQILDFEIVIDTGVSERIYMGLAGVGAEPQRKKRPSVRLSINAEFANSNALTEFLANTKIANLPLVFTSGSKSMTFTFSQIGLVEAVRHPAAGDDFITQRMVYELEDDNSDGTLSLEVVNTQATITT